MSTAMPDRKYNPNDTRYHSLEFLLPETHSGTVEFVRYNTWNDWRLIPASPPKVVPPKVRTKYIDIPGMQGQLDISEISSEETLYENRTGNWEFFFTRTPMGNGTVYSWSSMYHRLLKMLHGKKGRVILEDEPNVYYEGRFEVSDWQTARDFSKVTISYNLGPFSHFDGKINDVDGWLWDPFDFENYDIDMEANPRVAIIRGTL